MTENAETFLLTLRDPVFYPHQPTEVSVLETHISWVFLAGDLVYKCKKPVRFDFLDFSTLALRKQACEDEVRLNRRLAPQMYRRVVPITQEVKELQLDGDGPVVEWLVEMQRLPTDETLELKLRRGDLHVDDIVGLMAVLVPFYRSCEPAAISAEQYRARLTAHVQQNRSELLAAVHHLPGATIRRIHARQLQLLHLNAELFDQRVRAGKIIEGHGDLRPEHICCADPPVIFDCLEFSRDLRTLDIADDLAFLAMECDQLGAPWVGVTLFDHLRRHMDENTPELLFRFYKSYRACVRAKVAALRAEQLQGVAREEAIDQAGDYLHLADNYLDKAAGPLLLAVGGLSGTGKSSLARALGDTLGVEVLRSDVVRRELFPPALAAAITDGIYQPASRERVYTALLSKAEELLRARCSVILDATFSDNKHLRAAYELAQRASASFLAVECVCPAGIALQRIHDRAAAGADVSDADEAVYLQQTEHWQPWPEDIPQERVSTTGPLAATTQLVLNALAGYCAVS